MKHAYWVEIVAALLLGGAIVALFFMLQAPSDGPQTYTHHDWAEILDQLDHEQHP